MILIPSYLPKDKPEPLSLPCDCKCPCYLDKIHEVLICR